MNFGAQRPMIYFFWVGKGRSGWGGGGRANACQLLLLKPVDMGETGKRS